MIPVAYNHSPRKASFYLLYFSLLAFVLSPVLLIVTLWTSHLEAPTRVLLIGALTLLRVSMVARNLMVTMITVEDTGIPKDTDISDRNPQPPDTLANAMLTLELEGFERLGEYEGLYAGQTQPIPAWVYLSRGAQVAVTFLEIGNPPAPFIGFHTFGEHGVVQTTYPRGHQLTFEDAKFNGVRNSVEAAYQHHRRLVSSFRRQLGALVRIESIPHYLRLDSQYAPQFKKLMRHTLIDHVLVELFMSLVLTPGMLLLADLILPNSVGGVLVGDRLFWGACLLIIGLAGSYLVGFGSRGIKA